MPLANSNDGLWFNQSSTVTSAVRKFTRTLYATNAAAYQPMIRFTHNGYNQNYLNLRFWGHAFCERADGGSGIGTPQYASTCWHKGFVLWNASVWDVKYNDNYAYSSMNFNYYPYVDGTGSNQLTFRTHVYGNNSGGVYKATYSLIAMYERWDLITVSYP